jgi:hypothetical protein
MAIPCFMLMYGLGINQPVPDFIISESGRQVGLLDKSGALILTKPNAEKFTTKLWKQAYRANSSDQATHDARRCDLFGCVLTSSTVRLAHVTNTARLTRDCLLADILVIAHSAPGACRFLPVDQRPIILDADDLRQSGAHAVYLSRHKSDTQFNIVKIITTRNLSRRPWSLSY